MIAHRPSLIRFEQAVYGSFAFWDLGYALLAQSPGCRPEWLNDFRSACQKLGERPACASDASSLFALRLPSGPWAVVGISPQGRDDRGRPGALAFHGLFLSKPSYRKLGQNPFALAGALRSAWSIETRTLPAGAWTIQASTQTALSSDPRVARIVAELSRGRKVALESPEPIDDLARTVWQALPARVRARASLATWAFGNDNNFSLVAFPRLASISLDNSYVDPLMFEAQATAEFVSPPPLTRFPSPRLILSASAVSLGLIVGGLSLALRENDAAKPLGSLPVVKLSNGPFAPTTDLPTPDDPAEQDRVAEALADLAARFGVDVEAAAEPSRIMERFAQSLRYRGPWLSESEKNALEHDPDPDAAIALKWHAQAQRFADDRPLPADFRRRSLRNKLLALAWSFHSEAALDQPGTPRRVPSEMAQALGESLALDAPFWPNPLSERYPVLASYRSFLARLPRRR